MAFANIRHALQFSLYVIREKYLLIDFVFLVDDSIAQQI